MPRQLTDADLDGVYESIDEIKKLEKKLRGFRNGDYAEKKDLTTIDEKISALEKKIDVLHEKLNRAGSAADDILSLRLAAIESNINRLIELAKNNELVVTSKNGKKFKIAVSEVGLLRGFEF